jgi:hypothetical protein
MLLQRNTRNIPKGTRLSDINWQFVWRIQLLHVRFMPQLVKNAIWNEFGGNMGECI